jgi:hypothetical protein
MQTNIQLCNFKECKYLLSSSWIYRSINLGTLTWEDRIRLTAQFRRTHWPICIVRNWSDVPLMTNCPPRSMTSTMTSPFTEVYGLLSQKLFQSIFGNAPPSTGPYQSPPFHPSSHWPQQPVSVPYTKTNRGRIYRKEWICCNGAREDGRGSILDDFERQR